MLAFLGIVRRHQETYLWSPETSIPQNWPWRCRPRRNHSVFPFIPMRRDMPRDSLSFLPQLLSSVLDWLCAYPYHLIWEQTFTFIFILLTSPISWASLFSITHHFLAFYSSLSDLLGFGDQIPGHSLPWGSSWRFYLEKELLVNFDKPEWIHPGNLNLLEGFSPPLFRIKQQVTHMLTPQQALSKQGCKDSSKEPFHLKASVG